MRLLRLKTYSGFPQPSAPCTTGYPRGRHPPDRHYTFFQTIPVEHTIQFSVGPLTATQRPNGNTDSVPPPANRVARPPVSGVSGFAGSSLVYCAPFSTPLKGLCRHLVEAESADFCPIYWSIMSARLSGGWRGWGGVLHFLHPCPGFTALMPLAIGP